MKTHLALLLAALGLLAPPAARAWNYTNGSVLLVFRQSGLNDVELNLGDISQFTGQTAGHTAPVAGWNRSLVTNVFGADLTGVSVVVAATTSTTAANPLAWLSSGDPAATPVGYSFPTWRVNLYAPINSLGTRPATYLAPAADANSYSIDPGGTYRLAGYEYIISDGGVNSGSIATFGGRVPFAVEAVVPASFGFWQLPPVAGAAATYVGTFTIDSAGNLGFTAGPVASATPPGITGITRAQGVTSVTFTTTAGGNYSLLASTSLGAAAATWSTVNGPLSGDGNAHTLTHTTSGAKWFYRVVRTP